MSRVICCGGVVAARDGSVPLAFTCRFAEKNREISGKWSAQNLEISGNFWDFGSARFLKNSGNFWGFGHCGFSKFPGNFNEEEK